MTFLIFMVGVSLVLNACVGIIAWRAVVDVRAERAAHERTRRDVQQMLVELQRIKTLAMPLQMQLVPPETRKPVSLSVIIGTALAKYEADKARAA